jgi:hypothetical protein
MEVMAREIDGGKLGVLDDDAGRVGIGIDLGANLEAGFGSGRGDAPVLGDEGEESVLDLVPLCAAET